MQVRAVQTRRALLEAAAKVFDHEGYHGATTQAIVLEAGRTQGALYKHYRSKTALAEALMAEDQARRTAVVEQSRTWDLDAADTLQRLAVNLACSWRDDLFVRAASRIRHDYEHATGQRTEFYEPLLERVAGVLRDGQDEGSIAPGVDCAAAARVAVAGLYGVYDMAMRVGTAQDLAEKVRDWSAVLLITMARNAAQPKDPPG